MGGSTSGKIASVAAPLTGGFYSSLKSGAKKQKQAYQEMLLRQEIGRGKVRDLAKGAKKQGKIDYDRILGFLDENNRISQGGIVSRAQGRKKNLDELAQILATQQKGQLMDTVPALAEQANLKGIFRSTGLGNAISQEQARLARDTSAELSKYNLANEVDRIAELQGAEGNLLSGRQGALGRQFSLEDYANQAEMGLAMGEAGSTQTQPIGPTNFQTGMSALNQGIQTVSSIAPLLTGMPTKGGSAVAGTPKNV